MALNRLLMALALGLACTAPAAACTPMLSVGFKGLLVGYLLWLLLTPLAIGVPSARLFWVFAVPAGLLAFAVPMFAGLLLVPVLLAMAFPMHLALEFFDALFHPGTDFRGFRLVYNGLPLLVILVMGAGAKAALYGEYGGLRAFAWNYSHEAEAFFFAAWLALGGWLLLKHRSQNRAAWPF